MTTALLAHSASARSRGRSITAAGLRAQNSTSVTHDTAAETDLTRTIDIRPTDGGRLRIGISGDPPSWFWRLLDRVKGLLELQPGWNGHSAAPVPGRAAATLLQMAASAFDETTPQPSITPLSSGGVQMEWHEPDIEIEVLIDAAGTAHVWYEDSRTGEEGEFAERAESPERAEFPRFNGLVDELTRRA